MSVAAEQPDVPQGPQTVFHDPGQRFMTRFLMPDNPEVQYSQRALGPGESVFLPIPDMTASLIETGRGLNRYQGINAYVTAFNAPQGSSYPEGMGIPQLIEEMGNKASGIKLLPPLFIGDGRKLPAAYETGLLQNPETKHRGMDSAPASRLDMAKMLLDEWSSPSVVVGHQDIASAQVPSPDTLSYPLNDMEGFRVAALVSDEDGDMAVARAIPCPEGELPRSVVSKRGLRQIGWMILSGEGVMVCETSAGLSDESLAEADYTTALLVSATNPNHLQLRTLDPKVAAHIQAEPLAPMRIYSDDQPKLTGEPRPTLRKVSAAAPQVSPLRREPAVSGPEQPIAAAEPVRKAPSLPQPLTKATIEPLGMDDDDIEIPGELLIDTSRRSGIQLIDPQASLEG